MQAAQGILTARGGMTSHAAVVARGMGKCCVAGCGALNDRLRATRQFSVELEGHAHRRSSAARSSRIDGSTGEVMLGQVADGRGRSWTRTSRR